MNPPKNTITAIVIAMAIVTVILNVCCNNGKEKPSASETNASEQSVVNDTAMVFVEGGTFTMGCTQELDSECRSNERPPHSVTIGDFLIGKYEVTQRLWKQVMGDNPSRFQDDENLPVESVSYFGIKEFLIELNRQTGKKYRLPTEAEWEFAARGGNKSYGYKYSGGNDADYVAWYGTNIEKTQPVGTKSANELGIYDMSGNVWESVNDWAEDYTTEAKTNPTGPPFNYASTFFRVIRGGGWGDNVTNCRVFARSPFTTDESEYVGFRLALSPNVEETVGMETLRHAVLGSDRGKTVNDTAMVFVDGGTFMMGCTSEQKTECDNNEKPPRRVTVSDFLIGKYEVTQKLWNEVMGTTVLQQKNKADKSVQLRGEGGNVPMYYVNWDDVQEFIVKLNVMTGKQYRLPTEAEWEFAARGGTKWNGYKYSGGNDIAEVAWYYGNSGNDLLDEKPSNLDKLYDEMTYNNNRAHPVGSKLPNELGIYDMSGNVEEWVNAVVTSKFAKNSRQQSTVRGGSWLYVAKNARVSSRHELDTDIRAMALGFRLAMSPPNDSRRTDAQIIENAVMQLKRDYPDDEILNIYRRVEATWCHACACACVFIILSDDDGKLKKDEGVEIIKELAFMPPYESYAHGGTKSYRVERFITRVNEMQSNGIPLINIIQKDLILTLEFADGTKVVFDEYYKDIKENISFWRRNLDVERNK